MYPAQSNELLDSPVSPNPLVTGGGSPVHRPPLTVHHALVSVSMYLNKGSQNAEAKLSRENVIKVVLEEQGQWLENVR